MRAEADRRDHGGQPRCVVGLDGDPAQGAFPLRRFQARAATRAAAAPYHQANFRHQVSVIFLFLLLVD
jgi:hypothetical protein